MPYLGNAPAEAYSNIAYQDFGTQSGTTFTLDYPAGAPGELEVFVNNVRQEPSVAYTVSGTTLTMTGTIASTDDFYVVFQGKAQQTVRHPANTALEATTGTFSGALSATTGTFSGAVSMGANNITFSNGSGIDFSASAGSGASSSILDDYEEGTWTPAGAASSGTAPSFSASSGTYTKIGRLVTINASCTNITAGGTSNAQVQVTGLPFTPDVQDGFGACNFGHVTIGDSIGLVAVADASEDRIVFMMNRTGAGRTGVDNQHISSGVSDCLFTISYITNQ